MSVLLLFIDGIGIGSFDIDSNPFARFPSPYFSFFSDSQTLDIPHDGILIATDPTMQVKGLPQSATGQTALFTGKKASQILGRHHSGFPTPTLRQLIKKESIFLQIENLGGTGTFANALSQKYLQRPPRQISASTWSILASNFPLRMVEKELMEDQAISHDLTNEFLNRTGYKVPLRTPEESAEILAQITESVDFCLFEFILTDLVGHKKDMTRAAEIVEKLHRFLQTLLKQLDLKQHLVILTSDHGNFENLNVSTHTYNPVPTILWGRGASSLHASIKAIEDITPAIVRFLQNQKTNG